LSKLATDPDEIAAASHGARHTENTETIKYRKQESEEIKNDVSCGFNFRKRFKKL